MRFNERLSKTLIRERKVFFWGLVALCLGLGIFSKNIKVDNRLDVWFLENDPTLLNYYDSQSTYGNEEFIAIYFPAPNRNLDDAEYARQIFKHSKKIEEHSLVKRVYSLSHLPYISSQGGELIVEQILNEDDLSSNLKNLKARLQNDPKLASLVLAPDSSGSVLLIEPENRADFDELRPELLQFIKEEVGETQPLAGMGVLYNELNRISARDAGFFTGLSYILLFGLLFLLFRRLKILLAAGISVSLSLLLLFGIFGLAHASFNMVNMILPSLVLVTCLLDFVHIIRHWQHSKNFKESLSYCLAPCFLTSITTAAGLLALCLSPMAVLRSFGLFAAIALIIEFFVVMVVVSFFFSDEKEIPRSKLLEKLEGFVSILGPWVIRRSRKIIIASCFVAALIPFGISKLEVNTYSMGFLLEDNPIRQASNLIESEYGDYLALEVFFRTSELEGVKEPRFLQLLSRAQFDLEALPQVSYSLSIADLLKQIHSALTEEGRIIPATRQAAAQELLLYELDDDNQLESFVSPDYQEARISLRIPMLSSQEMKSLLGEVDQVLTNLLPPDISYRFGGYVPLYVKMMDYITQSQLQSFGWACLFIFFVMAFIFRSLRVFGIGVLVNLVPIGLTLASMGFWNIPLDIATVTIAALALGIVVDDTTHFIFKYQDARKTLPSSPAILQSFQASGLSNMITSILLIIGFSVMLFAQIKSVIFFGLLVGLCILLAALTDLLLLPSLLFQTDKKIELIKAEKQKNVR